MPMFSATKRPGVAAVAAAWAKRFPDGPRLQVGDDEDVAGFGVDDRRVMVAHVPVPIPRGEAVDAVRSSWMWQGSDDPVRAHRAHAIVTAVGSGNPVADAWDVARLSLALLDAADGAALYWGAPRPVHARRIVEAFAADAKKRPVPLWVGITISAPARTGPFSAATHGLEALGHKELEVLETKTPVGDLRMLLLDVASYVLDRGSVLLDGQTFGPNAHVRWTIRHTASKLVPGREAIVLGVR
ncbi:MAG TPA: DUF4261 domain-containing protein [Minicystis sp.]|nr:DUF4261 domain-containing protein [Minicystis sp.]